MAHDDVIQIRIRKRDGTWRLLPDRCASRAQTKGILARHVNAEYIISVNGDPVEHRKPHRGGFAGRINQAGSPGQGKKAR